MSGRISGYPHASQTGGRERSRISCGLDGIAVFKLRIKRNYVTVLERYQGRGALGTPENGQGIDAGLSSGAGRI
jgi:hypothetical protein